MNDDVQVIAMLFMLVAFLMLVKGRGMGRRQRRLEETIERLQATPVAPPRALPSATREQVERLEERVRVLERIVTDRGTSLAAEIEALRDEREVERSN